MSLMLKGIDMPKDTHGETVLDDIRLIFSNANTRFSISLDKDDIIQIPTPHGRLIDADALETIFKDMAKCEWNQKVSPISWAYAFEDTIDEIDNAPTILEAEE